MKELVSVRDHSANEPVFKDFGLALVRPDAYTLGLDEAIVASIEGVGLHVLKRKSMIINDAQFETVYEDLKPKPYYGEAQRSMVGKRIMPLVIGGEMGVSAALCLLKGSALDTVQTVRGNYSGGHLLPQELRDKFLSGTLDATDMALPEVVEIMREDRMHCEESEAEAIRAMRALFTDDELKEIVERYPEFLDFLVNFR
jgi:nucleoside diphosphate kinase